MVKRFQIEDLVVQDASGVVFRALDTETGQTVALRRFFPFGVAGGGLHEQEQAAYNIAIGRLSGLSHPALRSVICGGCDPVDGMPFIATEWIDGQPLTQVLANGPLSSETAAELLTQALEVCELLSHVLAEQAVWVETELSTIVVGSPESGRGFTFWISPLKWLGANEESRRLDSIVDLAEGVMGWTGRVVGDQAGRGMGAWVKWLRSVADSTCLLEAREMLAASVGAEPPPPAQHLVVKATTRPLLKSPGSLQSRASTKAPLFAASAMALLVAAAGTWLWMRQRTGGAPSAPTEQPAPLATAARSAADSPTPPKPTPSHLDEVNRRAAEISRSTRQADEDSAALITAQAAAAETEGAIVWDHHQLLVSRDKQEVVVEGVIGKIGASSSNKTLYLHFSENPGKNEARIAIIKEGAPADLTEDELVPLIGKKIRVRGTVALQKGFGLECPHIQIKDRAAITFPD